MRARSIAEAGRSQPSPEPSHLEAGAAILRCPVFSKGLWRSLSVAVLAALLLIFASAAIPVQGRVAETEEPVAGGFRLVVNADNPVEALAREEVEKIFLNRLPRWEDWRGQPRMEPVDQPDDSEVRRAFTAAVHRKTVTSMNRFWQRMIFSGRGKPPPIRDDDAAVLVFVSRNEGAIGYVAPGAALGVGVKAIEIFE